MPFNFLFGNSYYSCNIYRSPHIPALVFAIAVQGGELFPSLTHDLFIVRVLPHPVLFYLLEGFL